MTPTVQLSSLKIHRFAPRRWRTPDWPDAGARAPSGRRLRSRHRRHRHHGRDVTVMEPPATAARELSDAAQTAEAARPSQTADADGTGLCDLRTVPQGGRRAPSDP